MDQPQEIHELAHIPPQVKFQCAQMFTRANNFETHDFQNIPWEATPTVVDSRDSVPSVVARNSNNYKDKYGRFHPLEDDVSYFINPEDGVPNEVITQRSTKHKTVVITPQPHGQTTEGQVLRDGATSAVGGESSSWPGLAARAIPDRWSRNKDPPLDEDPQQQTVAAGDGVVNIKWGRNRMKNKSALAMQLIYWIYAGIPQALIAPQAANDEECRGPCPRTGPPSGESIKTWAELWHYDRPKCWRFAWRYFVGTIGLTAMLIWPSSIEEPLRNGGYFDPVRYRDWDYSQNARNIQEQEDHNADSPVPLESRHNIRDSATRQGPPTINDEDGAGPSITNSSSRSAGQEPSPEPKQTPIPESVWGRRILPTHLCFRNDLGKEGYECRPVDNLVGDRTSDDFEYAFISYSRKQFFTQNEDEIKAWKESDAKKGNHWSTGDEHILRSQIDMDRKFLTQIALKAIEDAGLKAFYIDYECVDPTTHVKKGKGTNTSEKKIIPDVYRICDAMRAARKMVVVLGPRNQDIFEPPENPLVAPKTDDEAKQFWLQQWGSRLWTLPELLLAPPGNMIDTYYLPSNPNKKESIKIGKFPKEKLVEVAFLPRDNNGKSINLVDKESWTKSTYSSRAYEDKDDATDVANLVDHFEGTLILPTLELITHLAQALWRREKSTFKFLEGDCSYALMGLLRRRPAVEADDKDFEAFARLSLANDSDRLLERVICLLPHERSASWHDWKDAWPEVRLWDIEPITQLAAIADNRTVVLDGAYGATIHWRKLHPVAFVKRKTVWRQVTKFGIRLGALYFIIAIILVAEARPKTISGIHLPPNHPLLTIGAILLVLTILVLIYAPWAMLKLYRGKFWGTQGWFFGIEGCADIGEVEKCLFGGNHNRLKWSTNGSMLSRHRLGRVHNQKVRECLPREPAAASWSIEDFERERNLRGGIERLYTLIDTYSMEATLFWAEVPPTVVFICGSEGGMKRAMLCSFDWKTNSFVRETVVRMKTMVVDKMFRVERFRFALSRSLPS